MLFAYLRPFSSLEAGPEFYNNMNASNNTRGPENDEASFYNNMAASRNRAGPESDEVSIYTSYPKYFIHATARAFSIIFEVYSLF
jgi:hypothetical protein